MPMIILAIMTRLARERDWVVSRRNIIAVAAHASASISCAGQIPVSAAMVIFIWPD